MPLIPNLPDKLAREIYADLCTTLPKPAENTPDAYASRNERAVTSLAHLLPENAAEAELAVDIVAARFHAKDALRSAARASDDPQEARRCRAQAASMLRAADSGMRTLTRMQAERVKAEAAMRPAAMERAGYWFRDCSVPAPEPPPVPVEAPPVVVMEDEEPQRSQEQIDHEVKVYRVIYPVRAAAIIEAGGFTPAMKFGPPDPYIVAGLLRGVGAPHAM